MAKRWRRVVWHVPKGVSYAVENSQWATRLAHRLGFRWIDKDCHITKDGVVVFGHWALIVRNQFILPAWFIKKYGKRPHVQDVYWEDLKQLVTQRIIFKGTRRYRFVRVEAGMALAHDLGMGIMLEQKGNPGFRHVELWRKVNAKRAAAGLAHNKLVVASLPSMRGAGEVFAAAHAAGLETLVIRAYDGVPRTWAPNLTWYRGRIKWL